MSHRLFSLTALTHAHPGEGQARAAVDQPVSRESVSGLPFVPGHAHKGALRAGIRVRNGLQDASVETDVTRALDLEDEIFGKSTTTGSGALLVGDIRLLLLPMRAEGYPFVLGTCPLLLHRLADDLEFADLVAEARALRDCLGALPGLASGKASLHSAIRKGAVHGFRFREPDGDNTEHGDNEQARRTLADKLTELLGLPPHLELETTLAVFNNGDFRHLAGVAPPTRARNSLYDNKTSERLWYEETLAPDTVMTTLLGCRGRIDVGSENDPEKRDWRDPVDLAVRALRAPASENAYLQIGGNETVGQGWFQLREAATAGRATETET